MKRFTKMLAVACVAALALAVSAAGASASAFTYSATGTLEGTQTSNTVITTGGGGSITCKRVHLTSTITSTSAETLEITDICTEVTAFGFPATVSQMTYELHANGEVDILNTITISVSGCTTTIPPQSGLKSVSYTNITGGELEIAFNLSGIKSTTSGFPCTGGTNGTHTGSIRVHRVGGGSIGWDV